MKYFLSVGFSEFVIHCTDLYLINETYYIKKENIFKFLSEKNEIERIETDNLLASIKNHTWEQEIKFPSDYLIKRMLEEKLKKV